MNLSKEKIAFLLQHFCKSIFVPLNSISYKISTLYTHRILWQRTRLEKLKQSGSISRKNGVHLLNPFMPTVAFNICCPRDCVSRHNGGTAGALLKPLRDDSALRALLFLSGLRGVPAVPPLCRETQSLGQQMLNATVGINGLTMHDTIE